MIWYGFLLNQASSHPDCYGLVSSYGLYMFLHSKKIFYPDLEIKYTHMLSITVHGVGVKKAAHFACTKGLALDQFLTRSSMIYGVRGENFSNRKKKIWNRNEQ